MRLNLHAPENDARFNLSNLLLTVSLVPKLTRSRACHGSPREAHSTFGLNLKIKSNLESPKHHKLRVWILNRNRAVFVFRNDMDSLIHGGSLSIERFVNGAIHSDDTDNI